MATRKTKAKTKKHHFHVTHIPVSSWIVFWLGIAATFVLIFVTFGSAFQAFVLDDSDFTSQALQQINQNLEKQVGELRGQAANPAPTNICSVENPGPADSHVLYVDPKTHVSMSLPYSTKWDEAGCIPTTLVIRNGGIAFGPIVGGEGVAEEDAFISIASSTDSNIVLKRLKEAGSGVIGSVRQRTVSGMNVLSYKKGEEGAVPVWEAFGRSYHYTISSRSWLTDAEAIKIIQSLKVVK